MADGFYVKKEKEKDGTHKAEHNWAWFVGCIILVLISVTFILPSTGLVGLGSHELVFGSFGNKKVVYDADSYFYRASEDMVRQYSVFGDGLREYAYRSAFNSSMLYNSYLYQAEKAGIMAGSRETDDYVINALKDADGNFASDYWKTLPDSSKKMIRDQCAEELVIRRVQSDFDNVAVNAGDVDFIYGNEKFASFKAVVVKGDNAAADADDILQDVQSGTSIEDAAKKKEIEVAVVQNVALSGKNMPFMPSRSYSGDEGKFYEALGIDTAVQADVFALEDGQLYGKVISVNDNEKVIVAKDKTVMDDNSSIKDSINDQVSYANSAAYQSYVMSSSLFHDDFNKAYSELFPPVAEQKDSFTPIHTTDGQSDTETAPVETDATPVETPNAAENN